jgi:hypothetical protein
LIGLLPAQILSLIEECILKEQFLTNIDKEHHQEDDLLH